MIHPAATFELHGHAAQVFDQIQGELAAGRMAHGILLAGPEGIGKATLAYALTRKLLGETDASISRILAGSHADLLVVERAFDEKKDEFAKDITVEQTRQISEALSMTAGEGAWRVVLVDGADSMNMNAANAILKILEEPPPNTVIVLVAHQLSRLLPTIRSRCRVFKINPVTPADFAMILRRHLPEISSDTIQKLGEISDYSPGLAIKLHGQGALDVMEQLELIFEELPALPHGRILAMAEMVATGKQHQNWQVFSRLILYWLAIQAREKGAHWAEKWQETAHEFALVENRHLDYKSAIISFFHNLHGG